MKVVLSSFGSSGDFNPCLGLGRALKQKGVDVLFLSNPFYEKQITDAGLRFCPAGEYFDVFKAIADNPDLLHARRGPKEVWKMVLKTVPVVYDAMTQLIQRESPDLIACHMLEYGGMIAAMNRSVPYATIAPNPMCWFNTHRPGYPHYAQFPLWLRRLHARLMCTVMNAAYRFSLKPSCEKQGIPPLIDSLSAMFGSARINLGLWSPLLRSAGPDDPPNSVICGFVRDEHVKDWPDVPAEIEQLFNGPKAPVVVGLGSTASLHGDTIYNAAAAACRTLDHPVLLVGKDMARYADPESRILATDFAPYGWVFPRARLVIHHGGVNTTAETLRAGAVALIIPHGYDQFDNAITTQKMGVTKRLKTSQVTPDTIARTIQTILNDQPMQQKAKEIAQQLQSAPDGAQTAAQHIIECIAQE